MKSKIHEFQKINFKKMSKKLSTLLFASLFAIVSYAQTNIPQLVSFSAVVRDANNQPLVNTPVSIRLTFKQGGQTGPLVYCALHQNTTNQNGFISLQLNRNVLGTACNGAPSTAFENIPWENGGFWMEVEYQTVPGSPFVNLGQLELASSFYAFAAGTAERIAGFDLSGANDGDVLTYNITTQQWEAMPPSGGGTGFSGDYNDLTNTPVLAPVATSGSYNDLSNTPTIPTVPSNVSAFTNDAGYVTTLNDDDPTNEIQQLSVSSTGDTLHLQNGGFVIIPGISAANTPSGGGSGTYPPGTVHCTGTPTAVVDVTNPTTGKTWMDRNLGASQAATSSTDANSYGDLYQWGRGADGHQCRTSPTTATLSSTDQPGHGDFITNSSSSPYDWRSPQNDNLWQGVNGVNNPCPSGYRLPTNAELDSERSSWSQNNSLGAFASPLKLPMAGSRGNSSGSLFDVGTFGRYWSSTVNGTDANDLDFLSSFAVMGGNSRALGLSVRCLKETSGTLGTLGSLNCGGAVNTGTLTESQAASGVSSSVPYTGGNGGTHSGQIVSSTGVTGLTATLAAGTFVVGSGNLTYTISGTPTSAGTASFALNIGGQSCTLTINVDVDLVSQYPSGSVFCASGPTAVVDVTNPSTGKTWMDRNLGASQAATSSTDANSYGDLYQWGRAADGHQCRNSDTTSTLSSTDQPAHGDFITVNSGNYDWRNPQNNNLWQGVNGVNNPCPSGYRLPTEAELNAERASWSQNNSAGAFASPLRLSVAGIRSSSNGSLNSVGGGGLYWSSTVVGTTAFYLNFSSNAFMSSSSRAIGLSVRCLKD